MAAPQLVLPVGWGRFSFRYRRVGARSKKRPQRGRLGSSGVCLGATGIKDTQAINSGTTSGAGTASAQSTWVDVFWTPVAITPASTEYLIISSPTSGNYAVAYGTGNPYGAGTALSAGADIGLGQYDLTFPYLLRHRFYRSSTRALQLGDDDPGVCWCWLHDVSPSQGCNTHRLIKSKSRIQRPPPGGLFVGRLPPSNSSQ
jgi:hypothetical protein